MSRDVSWTIRAAFMSPLTKVYRASSAGRDETRNWVDTKGRPLGIDFDRAGNLIVADGVRGLCRFPEGKVVELATVADGVPIRFADDVDCAADGRSIFRMHHEVRVKESGGTMEGSLLEIMEHGGHGRLLVYDPALAGQARCSRG